MKLRVIETFAGIGAQTKALKNIGIEHEVVAISEWNIDAIISYAYIHHHVYMTTTVAPDIDACKEYLSGFVLSADSKTPISVDRIPNHKIQTLYLANKITNNFGSIMCAKGNDLPTTDLLTYSFPCQALSVAGNQGGMEKGSGTTSSLLWEIQRILEELHSENRLPKYLLMENVPQLVTDKKFIPYFVQWVEFLSQIGYKTTHTCLTASDYGSPQIRKRAFAVQVLDGVDVNQNWVQNCSEFVFPPKMNIDSIGLDILDPIETIDERYYLDPIEMEFVSNKNEKSQGLIYAGIIHRYIKFISESRVYSPLGKLPTITAIGAQSRIKIVDPRDGRLRELTPSENIKLMGFDDVDFKKLQDIPYPVHGSVISKQAGNSISVQVLENIFYQMFHVNKTTAALFA